MDNNESCQYEIRIDGEKFMTGDEVSLNVVFNNLTGRNFSERICPNSDHKDWLDMMEVDFKMGFSLFSEVKIVSPENVLIRAACIGDGLPRPDPVIGQEYMVKTYPMGSRPNWTRTKLAGHAAETLVTRELFNFHSASACYPVTRADLMDRVMPVAIATAGAAMNVDKIACNLLEGLAVSAEEKCAVIKSLKARLASDERGDDVPILMSALGCDYDAACDAVFSGKTDIALNMLEVALIPSLTKAV